MLRELALLFVSITLLASGGCFDIEEKIVLKKDLSGTATVRMKVNMEPMVYFTLAMGKAMNAEKEGGEPEVSKAEMNKAKKEFMAKQKKGMKEDKKKMKAEIEKGLPEGVELKKLDVKLKGLELTYVFSLAFDHINKLAEVQLAQEARQEGGPKNPVSKPFEHLRVKQEGDYLTITSAPPNPTGEGAPPVKPDGGKQSPAVERIEKSMKEMRVEVEIQAPFPVETHNATKTKGKSLLWIYDFESLEKMSNTADAKGIEVKFKTK